MAFSFGNSGAAFGTQANPATSSLQAPQAIEGSPLSEISQNALIFKSIGGDSRLKILPNQWPPDSLPIPSASLLAVASGKDLVVAAGPDSLILAKASKVREFSKKKATDQGTFQPDVTIPIPRVSQVALSADENVLVVSPESGGGLAAYRVDGLLNNQTNPALQLSTNSTGLRALAPNPTLEKAELFAAVTSKGDLLIANLKSSSLTTGANGPVLKDQVTCVAWSNKGKQLIAGLGDGTAYQMTPEGEGKAIVPKPPSLPEAMHVSAISWLENDVFLVFYSEDSGIVAETYVITRKKNTAEFAFQQLPEVCPPLGMERTPNLPLLARLRNYPPHLSDTILVSSTCAQDIGLVTKSEKALSNEEPVTGAYTTTIIGEDQNKATLPFSQGGDTTAIGLSIDFSSNDVVLNPLQTHSDIASSKYPVPNLLVLNNEGVLCAWNIIYADSIIEEKAYPQLVVTGGFQQQLQSNIPVNTEAPTNSTSSTPIPGFGQSGLGQSGFGQPSQPSKFGQPAAASTFGAPTGQSGFGQSSFGSRPATSFRAPSTLGGAKPSWVTTGIDSASKPQNGGSGFGQPSFGSPAALSSATPRTGFGASGVKTGATPAFGQSTFGQTSNAAGTPSPFSTGSNKQTNGFAGFASEGGMSGFGTMKQANDSPFGAKPKEESIFGKSSTLTPQGGDTDMTSSFGTPESKQTEGKGLFGFPQSGFKIGSTFKPDPQLGHGESVASNDTPSLGFGKGFSELLKEDKKEAPPAQSKDESMDESDASIEKSLSSIGNKGATPPSFAATNTQAKSQPTFASSFGTQSKSEKPPTTTNTLTSWTFNSVPSTTPKEEPKNLQFPTKEAPAIKTESPSDNEATTPINKFPISPLPPDSVSKTSYTPGDTSTSSIGSHKSSSAEEAPLPPDFTSVRDKTSQGAPIPTDGLHAKLPAADNDSPLNEPPRPAQSTTDDEQPPLHDSEEPESDLDGSFSEVSEASGPTDGPSSPSKTDEVAGDATEELKTSPESSFDHAEDTTDTTKFTRDNTDQPPKLFGEIPKLEPRQVPESPRSPSPIRNVFDPRRTRLEPPRSFSDPSQPHNIIASRRAELAKGSHLGQQPLSFEEIRRRGKKAAVEKAEPEPEQGQELEDDEDELLREELARPVSPSPDLGPFLDHQTPDYSPTGQGIPGQIERLYRDINSMIGTLGLNARALSAFILHQTQTASPDHQREEFWNTLFRADDVMDTLRDDWTLGDIAYFHHGEKSLEDLLEEAQIADPSRMLQFCHSILSKDLVHLRTRLLGIRKTLFTLADTKSAVSAPLSGEQAALQDELRKASADVQTKIAHAEQSISMLRAKLSESGPALSRSMNGVLTSGLSRANSQRKPTVEAVTSTIAKMTSMAERKSSDIDVLEAQLRNLNIDLGGSVNGSREASLEPESATPKKRPGQHGSSLLGKASVTPGSVYHTPDSKLGASTNSLRASLNGEGGLIPAEDAEYWRERARRKKEVNHILKAALIARRSKGKDLPTKAGWKKFAASTQG